jgi:hypothetical protein
MGRETKSSKLDDDTVWVEDECRKGDEEKQINTNRTTNPVTFIRNRCHPFSTTDLLQF